MCPQPVPKASAYGREIAARLEGPVDLFRLHQIVRDCLATIERVPLAQRVQLENIVGACYLELGKFRSALKRFNSAFAIDPQHRPSQLNSALALARLNRTSDALERLMKLAGESMDANVLTALSSVLAQMGQVEDARDALEDAAELARTTMEHFRAAVAAADLELHVEACEMFARALSIEMKKDLGNSRSIDFIHAAPAALKGCLQYEGAQSLKTSIALMTANGDELLSCHRIMLAAMEADAPSPEAIKDAEEVFAAMAPLRARAMLAVMVDDGNG